MIASTQITNRKNSAILSVLVFQLLSCKALFINTEKAIGIVKSRLLFFNKISIFYRQITSKL